VAYEWLRSIVIEYFLPFGYNHWVISVPAGQRKAGFATTMTVDRAGKIDVVGARNTSFGVVDRSALIFGFGLGVVVIDQVDVDGAAAAGVARIGFLVEADPIALPELLKALILDGRTVEEQVAVRRAAIARNEAEAFVSDRLDRSGCHRWVLSAGASKHASRRDQRSGAVKLVSHRNRR